MPSVEGEEEPRPLSRMRRVIADRLTQSWTTTPHFTVTIAVDVTALLALRAELKAAGTNLTVTDFVLAATAQTLAEFPDVNSRTDGVSVWPRRRVHLGLAVSLPGGLVVPVIRDADRLPIGELHDRAAALAAKAREGTLPVDDMTGSTFTVSNLGMFGVEEFSAIINPGEAAILAVASAIPTAVAIGDGLAVRSIMKLTLSADHRLVDGEMGARFLGAIRRRLEDAGIVTPGGPAHLTAGLRRGSRCALAAHEPRHQEESRIAARRDGLKVIVELAGVPSGAPWAAGGLVERAPPRLVRRPRRRVRCRDGRPARWPGAGSP